MIIWLIAGGAYLLIGLAFMNAIGKNTGYSLEWLVNLILAFFWPYFMLVRFFAHREFLAEQKRLKAKKEAEK
jgi:hypothetical protein